jgi:hypothetical protein
VVGGISLSGYKQAINHLWVFEERWSTGLWIRGEEEGDPQTNTKQPGYFMVHQGGGDWRLEHLLL